MALKPKGLDVNITDYTEKLDNFVAGDEQREVAPVAPVEIPEKKEKAVKTPVRSNLLDGIEDRDWKNITTSVVFDVNEKNFLEDLQRELKRKKGIKVTFPQVLRFVLKRFRENEGENLLKQL